MNTRLKAFFHVFVWTGGCLVSAAKAPTSASSRPTPDRGGDSDEDGARSV
jgi:hypothetical protein